MRKNIQQFLTHSLSLLLSSKPRAIPFNFFVATQAEACFYCLDLCPGFSGLLENYSRKYCVWPAIN